MAAVPVMVATMAMMVLVGAVAAEARLVVLVGAMTVVLILQTVTQIVGWHKLAHF
jgi:hypothetical protein